MSRRVRSRERRPGGGACGFTLIEVMVVLVIMGLVISGVSWSLGALRERDSDLALERLRWALEATAERARNHGRPIAFELVADGYRFSVLEPDGRWIAFEAAPIFVEKRLPESLRWGGLRTDAGAAGRIVFGTRAPRFQLIVRTPQGAVRYSGRATGAVRVDRISGESLDESLDESLGAST